MGDGSRTVYVGRWHLSPRETVAAIGLVGVLAAVAFVLYLIPVSHPYSFTILPSRPGPGSEFHPPSGSTVEGSWSTAHRIVVNLAIQDAQNVRIYSSFSTDGAFSFTATNPPYFFYVSSSSVDTVRVNGTFYSPIL
jgi:hypothetical protein